jgi:LuxR family maltose regulon positive regulatory protein
MQRSQLLATKLFAIRTQPDIIHRDRLIRKLDAIPQRTLTLLSAPAGFGKTTVISEWIELHGYPSAWLSLDSGDNDFLRFLSYVIASLQRVQPETGAELLRAIEGAPRPPVETMMTVLLNDIARVSDDFLLVLDDYHVIENPEIHQALLFLVDHAPAHFHLAITTRIDPEIPLSRFRVRGQLLEIRAADLRFTRDESAMLFNGRELPLQDPQITALAERTEGWIAGLKMAALSLQGRDDVDGFIDAFTGTDRYVLDYLLEEVLGQQPPEVQRALLQISILERFNASLCEAVTECPSGTDLLATLEHSNLFLVSLDNQRQWYRYHQLFGDLLRHHFRRQENAGLELLHRRASRWYDDHGYPMESLGHARESGDVDLLVSLLEKHWLQIVSPRGVTEEQITSWLGSIPESTIYGSPRLAIIKGWPLVTGRDVAELERLLESAEAVLADMDDPDRHDLLAYDYYFRISVAHFRGDFERAIEYCQKAIDQVDQRPQAREHGLNRERILMYKGLMQLQAGDPLGAEQTWEDVLRWSRAQENTPISITMLHNLSMVHLNGARLDKALACCDEILSLKEGVDNALKTVNFVVDVAHARQKRAAVFYERNQIEEARAEAMTARELYPAGMSYQLLPVLKVLIQINEALGNWSEVHRIIEECERLPMPRDIAQYQTAIATMKASSQLREGNIEGVAAWATKMFGSESADLPHRTYSMRKLEQIVYLRYLLAIGRNQEASELIASLEPELTAHRYIKLMIEMHLLHAILHDTAGAPDKALDSFSQGLRLAAPAGMIRTIVNEGAVAARLLMRYMERRRTVRGDGIPLSYLNALQEAFGFTPLESITPTQLGLDVTAGMNPLTDRELEILQLMSQGYSNQKIAGKLYISVNTVKTHVSNVFGKLEATNRTEAIVRAREDHLL